MNDWTLLSLSHLTVTWFSQLYAIVLLLSHFIADKTVTKNLNDLPKIVQLSDETGI